MAFFLKNKRKSKLSSLSGEKRYSLSEKGYSLVEVLMYLSILLMLVVILFPIIHTFFKPSPIFTHIRLEREASLFFQHTEIEVNEAKSYHIESNILHLHSDSGEKTYEQYGEKIRRRKQGEGHIVMAQFVKEVRFSPVNEDVFHVSLKLEENNIEYELERWMGLKINGTDEDSEDAEEEI